MLLLPAAAPCDGGCCLPLGEPRPTLAALAVAGTLDAALVPRARRWSG